MNRKLNKLDYDSTTTLFYHIRKSEHTKYEIVFTVFSRLRTVLRCSILVSLVIQTLIKTAYAYTFDFWTCFCSFYIDKSKEKTSVVVIKYCFFNCLFYICVLSYLAFEWKPEGNTNVAKNRGNSRGNCRAPYFNTPVHAITKAV